MGPVGGGHALALALLFGARVAPGLFATLVRRGLELCVAFLLGFQRRTPGLRFQVSTAGKFAETVRAVYLMKDRAGTIGVNAVRPVVEALVAGGAEVRLIGHSYGCRVVLAALATGDFQSPVRSALLPRDLLPPVQNGGQYSFAQG